jgi:phosphatidylserine/phosphatidylglycerophosphate/cardiolipin synthase-like enzyme
MTGSERELLAPARVLAEQAFSRATGGPLVAGNGLRLLKDARENYPAWLDAIASARRFVHFESYIIHDDAAGDRFSEALIARARDGVHLRLDRRIRQDLAPVLESPPRGWGRGPLLQPSDSGEPAGLAEPGPSQDARCGRHGRFRQWPLRRTGMGR